MVDGSFFEHFPSEIISLILIKLPVKTLSTLKCVCRYFYQFVSCSDFIKEHLKFSTEDVSMSSYNIMFQEKVGNEQELKLTSIRSLWCESSINVFNLKYLQSELNGEIVGSCNGLVIIMNQERLFLWNPTIRKHEKLPTIARHENLHFYRLYRSFLCGFGFDASNDDYKIVALIKPIPPDSTSINYEVYVYSLKRNSWFRISDFNGKISDKLFDDPFAKFVCGKIHWIHEKIISFDVEREVFGTLEQPTYGEGCFSVTLSGLGGSICLCCDYLKHLEIWVMNEYGIKESWTKIFIISDNDLLCCPLVLSLMPNGEILIEVSIMTNGEVLNEDNRYIYFYNPRDGSKRSTEVIFHPSCYSVIYVESLISPCSSRWSALA